MGEGESSASLFAQFITEFDTEIIFNVGWQSVQGWHAIITGIIIMLAILIRSGEEQVNMLGGGKSGYAKAITEIGLAAFFTAFYFALISLVMDFFNSIYGVFDTNSITGLSDDLSDTLGKVRESEYKFDWRDIFESILGIIPLVGFMLTKMILIITQLFLKIGHSLLLIICAFYGTIAIPLAIIKGLNLLKGFKVMVLFVFLWPIVEIIFSHLVTELITEMLARSALNTTNIESYDVGVLVFFLTAYIVINCLLLAVAVAAPFVAMSMAANSGNALGLVGAFGAAGVAAGAMAGASLMRSMPSGLKNRIMGNGSTGGKSNLQNNNLNRNSLGGVNPLSPSALNQPQKNTTNSNNTNTQNQTTSNTTKNNTSSTNSKTTSNTNSSKSNVTSNTKAVVASKVANSNKDSEKGQSSNTSNTPNNRPIESPIEKTNRQKKATKAAMINRNKKRIKPV